MQSWCVPRSHASCLKNSSGTVKKSLINCTAPFPHLHPLAYSCGPKDDYYNPGFSFCQPEGGPKKEPESLGSILFGDRIFNSPYDVRSIVHTERQPGFMWILGSHDAGQRNVQGPLHPDRHP